MATSAESEIKTVQEVIDKLKADPTSLSVGVQPASADLVNLMLFVDANGISREGLRLVTYDGGGPLTSALLGQKIDAGFSGLPEFQGSIESGELRVRTLQAGQVMQHLHHALAHEGGGAHHAAEPGQRHHVDDGGDAAASVLEDPYVRERAKTGLDYLYNMRYDEAERVFAEIDQ